GPEKGVVCPNVMDVFVTPVDEPPPLLLALVPQAAMPRANTPATAHDTSRPAHVRCILKHLLCRRNPSRPHRLSPAAFSSVPRFPRRYATHAGDDIAERPPDGQRPRRRPRSRGVRE